MLVSSMRLGPIILLVAASEGNGLSPRVAFCPGRVSVIRRVFPTALLLGRDISDEVEQPQYGKLRRNGRGGVQQRSESSKALLRPERHRLAWRLAQKYAGSKAGTSSMESAMAAVHQGDAGLAVTLGMRALAIDLELGRQPQVRACNQLLRELGDCGRLDEMMDFFEAMQLAGVQPTQVTYGTLISRAGSSGQPMLASQCFRDMQRRGLEPDVKAFNSLINAFAKTGEVAKVTLRLLHQP